MRELSPISFELRSRPLSWFYPTKGTSLHATESTESSSLHVCILTSENHKAKRKMLAVFHHSTKPDENVTKKSKYKSMPLVIFFTLDHREGIRLVRKQQLSWKEECINHRSSSQNRSINWVLKRPSHGKLKLANSCWQTQVGVCERHKNSRQTRLYLTPTVCKRVCRLFLCRSLTPTWVCQLKFAVWRPL